MPPKMNYANRQCVLQTLRWHYQRAIRKAAKTQLLNHASQVLGLERKYLIKCLRPGHGKLAAKAKRSRGGSAKKYLAKDIGIIKALWLLAEQPCGKRLHAVLPLWLPAWEREHGALEADVQQRLVSISPAQLDRVLAAFKVRARALKLANQVRHQIPVRTGPWEVHEPGWIEADTVAHCGGSMRGTFAWSLVLTDIATGWTEAGATWNRSDRVVHACITEIEARLPFPILGFDSDNGGEFINEILVRYFRQRTPAVQQTRSRPYHKNDNAHVEQKNRTHIRALLGQERLQPQAIVEPLQALLRDWSLWNNLYSPTLKLLDKAPAKTPGGKPRRIYEKHARTPCQRLLEHPALSATHRAQLQAQLASHDPILLKARIETQLASLWQSVHTHAAQSS